jgi:hypothetical protein|tara:strand:- start:1678 stop:1899 length:222 start_codon:yes stop_codon:yes gene_type:complete
MSNEESRFLKVEGNSFLVRDTVSNAIINQDEKSYAQYKNLRKVRGKERERLDKLENDVSEIKDLLIQLINKDK